MKSAKKRIAVLGLYNSGSTVLAGMLHRLGVNMGRPFWHNSEEGHPENFYEARQLSGYFRHWFCEPLLQERAPATDRVRVFQRWAELQETAHAGPLGIKHPLLSLCAKELIQAWGGEVRLIRAWRPLSESISGLERRGWFPGYEHQIQNKLWTALEELENSCPQILRMDHHFVTSHPTQAALALASALGLNATEPQLRSAAALVRQEMPQRIAA